MSKITLQHSSQEKWYFQHNWKFPRSLKATICGILSRMPVDKCFNALNAHIAVFEIFSAAVRIKDLVF
jgi:hypothetical protein